jgi:transcriptional regulator with PAS, ATPase and Fis domain
MKIAMVAPYPEMARDAEEVCRMYGERIEILLGRMSTGVQAGKRAMQEGAGVLISRGGTFVLLSRQLPIPVVEIAVTPYDVLRALSKARTMGTRFGIAGFYNVIEGLSDWGPLLKVPVVPVEINADDEATKRAVKQAIRENGVDCLLGDTTIKQYAQELGIPCVLIESGKESIWHAIQEGKRIVAARLAEREKHASLHSVLDRVNQGLIVMEDGIVQFTNRVVSRLVGRDSCVGLCAKDCLPATLCDFVLKCDEARSSDIVQIGGKLWFVEKDHLLDDSRCFVALYPADDIESIERQVRQQRRQAAGHVARYTFDDLYGQSRAMRYLIFQAIHYAQTDSSVLIIGETGTGKELLAQSIHNASNRSDGPFVAVNCAALPDNLLESELFGYEEGAFTGARRGGKPGLFELAHRGTIFLDEIGETALGVQQRLLRVLQERKVMRIGGERVIPIDVRVIAATNRPLWQYVEDNKFRKDLLFRIDVLRLNTVPLRDRLEDIPELMERLLYDAWYKRNGMGVRPRVHADVYPLLKRYNWPGNVRELQNMIDYLLATAVSGHIDVEAVRDWQAQKAFPGQGLETAMTTTTMRGEPHGEMVPVHVQAGVPVDDTLFGHTPLHQSPVGQTMDEIQQWAIEQTLAATGGDMTRAAQILGVSRTTLWRKLKQREVSPNEDCMTLCEDDGMTLA